jgi:hypothetical protein
MNRARPGFAILVLLWSALFAGLGALAGHRAAARDFYPFLLWGIASFSFGALVGLSEILSRYRDEPIRASTTVFGAAYLFLNGIISFLAFAVLCRYPAQVFPSIQKDLFLTSVVAGFGAMTVFRSKLFTFRSPDGKEYPIGPAIVLDTILKMIDSKIDRRRATERQAKVFQSMQRLNDFADTANYIEASLGSFQNLSQDDKAQIKAVIDQYRQVPAWPDTLKSLGLGFAFLNIAGEENFDQVISNLNQFVEAQNKARAAAQGGQNP